MTTTLMRRVTKKEKKPFRVAIIGARCVGKSAMTVRIKTRRFIHDYAPNMESQCIFPMTIDDETINVELLDSAALQTAESAGMEEKIKWADAFILVYSITDEASLSALVASKCLINLYARRKKKQTSSYHPGHSDLIVALVGNKNDLEHERVVSEEQARSFAEVNECSHFFELSSRESYDGVRSVFETLYRSYKLKNSTKTSARSPSPRPSLISSPSSEFGPEETSEYDRISRMRQRGRSKTTLEVVSTPLQSAPDHHYSTLPGNSPVTFRKIITEENVVYSSSPEEDGNFIAEEILYNADNEDKSPPNTLQVPSRRITVHTSPVSQRKLRGLLSPSLLRRADSVDPRLSSDKNNNNNKRFHKFLPTIKLGT